MAEAREEGAATVEALGSYPVAELDAGKFRSVVLEFVEGRLESAGGGE